MKALKCFRTSLSSNARDLERARQSTLEEVLARQPGSNSCEWQPGRNDQSVFRGTNSKHVLLLVDGMRVGSATAGDVQLVAHSTGANRAG